MKRLQPDFRGSFLQCACSRVSCSFPAGDSSGSECRIELHMREAIHEIQAAHTHQNRRGGSVALGQVWSYQTATERISSRAVGVAKEGRCGVPDPHSHSCWACDAFETPADILVWTRACKMLLCDCACRTCFECGHLRNAAASMAHAQRASMGMSAVPQAVWSTRRCIECEWRWSGVCMAVYQEHFHPVPRSTAA